MQQQIAATIWQQMRAIDYNLCLCLGIKRLRAMPNGLAFSVNGLSFKGEVRIELTPADLYKITLLQPKRHYYQDKQRYFMRLDAVKIIDGVFVEDLMPLLELNCENRHLAEHGAAI